MKDSSPIRKKKQVLESLKLLGGQLYDEMNKKQFPWIKMPSRSIGNILYDEEYRQYILGNKAVKRSSRNIRHIRPLTQLVWAASFIKELIKQNKTSTLRDIFYSAQAFGSFRKLGRSRRCPGGCWSCSA